MNVGSQASVVSEIVPRIIGIFVNGDGVAVPVPIDYIWPVSRCDLKVITVEPESLTVAALNMEYMTRSEPEPKLTVREWVVDAGNVLMLNPLFPFDARPGSSDPPRIRGAPTFLWPTASGLAAARLRPPSLWCSGAVRRPRLRRAACRTMLRKVLPALMILRSAVLSSFFLTASLLRIQALTYVDKQTH
jgi:hypothetical protein